MSRIKEEDEAKKRHKTSVQIGLSVRRAEDADTIRYEPLKSKFISSLTLQTVVTSESEGPLCESIRWLVEESVCVRARVYYVHASKPSKGQRR